MKGGTDLMRSARIAGLVVAVSLAVTGIGSSQTTDAPVQLKDVSIERAFDGAAVTVKTSGPTQYEAKLIDSPDPARHRPQRGDLQLLQVALDVRRRTRSRKSAAASGARAWPAWSWR